MATRRPFGRAPLGVMALPAALCGHTAAELFAWLYFCSERRALPGLVSLGEAGIAEKWGASPATTRKRLRELESAGLILVDRRVHQSYVLGAIKNDGPTSTNAAKAMARQWCALPESELKQRIAEELFQSVTDREELGRILIGEGLSLGRSLAASHKESRVDSLSARLTPSLVPLRSSDPQTVDPQTSDPQAAGPSEIVAAPQSPLMPRQRAASGFASIKDIATRFSVSPGGGNA